jgi:hypothetical protein
VSAEVRAEIEQRAQQKVRRMMELKNNTLRAQKQRMAHAQLVAKAGPLHERVHVSHSYFKAPTAAKPIVSATMLRTTPALAKALARQGRKKAQRKTLPLLYNKTAAGLGVEKGDLAAAAAMRGRVRDLVSQGMGWGPASKLVQQQRKRQQQKKTMGPKTLARRMALAAEKARQEELAAKPLATRVSVAASDLVSSLKASVVSTSLFMRLKATVKELLPHEVKDGSAELRAKRPPPVPFQPVAALSPAAKKKKAAAAASAAAGRATADGAPAAASTASPSTTTSTVAPPPTEEEIELAREERARQAAESAARRLREEALVRERARLLEIARERERRRTLQKAAAEIKAKAAENARKAKAAKAKAQAQEQAQQQQEQ